MVAVIRYGSSLQRTVNYNEKKVQEGVANCIAAGNYPIDVNRLTFNQKLNRLQHQAELNIRTKVNSVHISLNFDPSEKLSEDELKDIATVYLRKIGFENQPYLLYQHNDSGHPHVHIVTTNIKVDGRRIELHNLGKNQSEKARKEIEIQYGLIKAESKKKKPEDLNKIVLQKVRYGRTESRRAIAKVLEEVLNNYRYSSLPELNAVLNLYNVLADRGNEQSRTYIHRGLLYHVLDEKGERIGVPIKASSFYNKPTLKFLEAKFPENSTAKQPFKLRVKNAIDLAILRQKDITLSALIKVLEREGIHAVLRQNSGGLIYGITYVDHETKCVFNGSDLGKEYSAKGIQERCLKNIPAPQNVTAGLQSKRIHQDIQNKQQSATGRVGDAGLLDILLQAENTSGFVPYALTKKGQKKKKKKSQHL